MACERLLTALLVATSLPTPGVVGAQTPPRWTLNETLRIGSLDDPAMSLTAVSHLGVSPEGRLYVGQPHEALIRVFDLEGSLVRTIGGRGEGPGEFRFLSGFGWIGGRLYAIDPGLGRVTIFGSDGSPASTLRWDVPRVGGAFVARAPSRLLPDSTAIALPDWQARSLTTKMAAAYPVLRTTWDGVVLDTITTTSIHRIQLSIDFGTRQTYTSQPFSDAPIRAVGPDGAVYLLDREVPDAGRPSTYRLTKVDRGSDTVFVTEIAVDPRPLPESVRDSALFATAQRMAEGSGSSLRDVVATLRERMFLPAFYPPATFLAVGSDRKIWVRREAPPGARSVRWDVLSPNGIRIAHVIVGLEVRILESVDGAVWLTTRDGFDVPYVVRSEIVRGPRD